MAQKPLTMFATLSRIYSKIAASGFTYPWRR